jgi:hypothetical protein
MTDDPKPDALQHLAAAAAALIVNGQGKDAIRQLATTLRTDERAAIRVGRLIGGCLDEWLRRGPPP